MLKWSSRLKIRGRCKKKKGHPRVGGGVGERESPEGPPKESSEDPAELPPPVEKITNLNKAGTKKPIT